MMRRIGFVMLLAGVTAAGASLAACSSPGDNPGGDDGGPVGDGAGQDSGKDATGGDSGAKDSGGKDSGGNDATSDAADGSTSDGADGSGDDASEAGDDGSEAGDDATDGSNGDATDGGNEASDADSGDAGDAADADDASDASDASVLDGGSVYGSIFFESVPAFNVGAVGATFYPTPQPLLGTCTTTSYGACTHYDCSNQADAGAPIGAGTLTVTGGTLGNGVMITQGMGGSYQYQSMSALFAQGDTLGVSATGGTIPAFGPIDVVGTGIIAVTAPVPNGMGVYTINTAQALPLTWTGGEANALALFEVSANFGTGSRGVLCFYDATLGSSSIPSAAMSNLTGGSGPAFVYGQWRETDFTAGAYPLRAVALQLGEGQATLQ
jgi:hypothetical protein